MLPSLQSQYCRPQQSPAVPLSRPAHTREQSSDDPDVVTVGVVVVVDVEVDTVVASAVVEGVVAVAVVGVVVVVAVVLLAWHCSRLGCLGPDTALHCLAPVSRMLQTWPLRL